MYAVMMAHYCLNAFLCTVEVSDASEELLQALVPLSLSLACALHQQVCGHSRHTQLTDIG